MDTVDFDPQQYVRVVSRDGQSLYVNRECLNVSPFFRRIIAKRANIQNEDVIITFGVEDDVESAPTEDSNRMWAGASSTPLATDSSGIDEVGNQPQKDVSHRSTDLHPVTQPTNTYPPIVTIEKFMHDASICITFPKMNAATLDTVIAYLYYKQRYEGHVSSPIPEMEVPVGSAIEIMKLAAVLEC